MFESLSHTRSRARYGRVWRAVVAASFVRTRERSTTVWTARMWTSRKWRVAIVTCDTTHREPCGRFCIRSAFARPIRTPKMHRPNQFFPTQAAQLKADCSIGNIRAKFDAMNWRNMVVWPLRHSLARTHTPLPAVERRGGQKQEQLKSAIHVPQPKSNKYANDVLRADFRTAKRSTPNRTSRDK